MKPASRVLALTSALAVWVVPTAFAQTNEIDQLANQLLAVGYPTTEVSQHLKDELLFQSAVQTYLWALPALNMYGMKEGSEKTFGKGYNVLPIWKQRLSALVFGEDGELRLAGERRQLLDFDLAEMNRHIGVQMLQGHVA